MAYPPSPPSFLFLLFFSAKIPNWNSSGFHLKLFEENPTRLSSLSNISFNRLFKFVVILIQMGIQSIYVLITPEIGANAWGSSFLLYSRFLAGGSGGGFWGSSGSGCTGSIEQQHFNFNVELWFQIVLLGPVESALKSQLLHPFLSWAPAFEPNLRAQTLPARMH